jgi:hypothetical protein
MVVLGGIKGLVWSFQWQVMQQVQRDVQVAQDLDDPLARVAAV